MLYSLVGYGVSNKALCKVLIRQGHRVFVSEARSLGEIEKQELLEMNVEFEENGNTEKILKADWIVASPSVRPDHPIVSKASEKVLTDLDVVLSSWKPGFIIAVTGTNGKTTTCQMLGYVLKEFDKKVAVVGNVGNPIANIVDERFDYLVIEISSFQLFWSKKLPIDIGVILNIEPNHLDWHHSFEHYVESKLKLLMYAKERYVHESCKKIAEKRKLNAKFFLPLRTLDGDRIEFRGRIYPLRNELLKTHQNLHNLSAVLVVLESLGFEPSKVLEVLENFIPPQHRMQLIAIVDDVRFVDDSKSTCAAATMAALQNYEDGRVILILTGRGKNENYDAMIEQIKKKVKHVVIFGEIASVMSTLLRAANVPFSLVENMEQAVFEAFKRAGRGDTVLLSPAAASFDLYKNYAERGEHFIRVVQSLKEGT